MQQSKFQNADPPRTGVIYVDMQITVKPEWFRLYSEYVTGFTTGIRFPEEQNLLSPQCPNRPHPVSCPMGTELLSEGATRPRREAKHSPPPSAEIKNVWSYTSTLLQSARRTTLPCLMQIILCDTQFTGLHAVSHCTVQIITI
jgi:hypothetical protein